MKASDTTNPQDIAIDSLMASGFPFQTAITNVIKQTPNWKVMNEEFPWKDDSGSERFLDIIATNGSIIIALECKKTQKEILTFLCPGEFHDDKVERVRCLYLCQIQDSTLRMEVFGDDWCIMPSSSQSMFCVVSTSEKGKDQRLLERDAHLLINGINTFAKVHRRDFRPQNYPEPDRPYLPLLVTNAPLFVAHYEPSNISLETGQFSEPPKNIESVKWVRFSKAFALLNSRDIGVRTVIVVNAIALSEFLKTLNIKGTGPIGTSKVHVEFLK